MNGALKIVNANQVVMVDDNEGDLLLVELCLERSRLENPWLPFTNGPDFLAYLDDVKAGGVSMPAVVLLDINMPGMNGLEVLEQVRSDSSFDDLPVLCILTSSADPDDRARALALGAAGFVTKPASIAEYVAFLDGLA